jgi:hypothetical protein
MPACADMTTTALSKVWTSNTSLERGRFERVSRMISVRTPFYGSQSAMKMLNSRGSFPWRVDAKTSFLPSRENIGKLSKRALSVIRSKPVPSMFTV